MNFVYRAIRSQLRRWMLVSGVGVDGVRGRTELFEKVVEGLTGSDHAAARARHGNLAVSAGDEPLPHREVGLFAQLSKSAGRRVLPARRRGANPRHRQRSKAGENGSTELSPTDLVLTPAACYPLYPLVAARGAIPATGLVFDVAADCFRHEPSRDVDRLQSFRMREFVCMGTPDQVISFRERWMARAPEFADLLGVKYRIETASDPFFGRVGKLMATSQIEQAMKFELLIPVRSGEEPTACMSFNYHRDHFGGKWGLRTDAGEVAHTGCVAFGIDRLGLALFASHGLRCGPGPSRRARRCRSDWFSAELSLPRASCELNARGWRVRICHAPSGLSAIKPDAGI